MNSICLGVTIPTVEEQREDSNYFHTLNFVKGITLPQVLSVAQFYA